MSLSEKDEVMIDTYRKHTRIHISRVHRSNDLQVIEVGDSHCVWLQEDKWNVGHRWRSNESGLDFDAIGVDDGGGVFESLESALRTALSLEFDARLCDAWAEVGENESEAT